VKIDKVREMGPEELENKARDLEEEIFHARVRKETGQLDKSSQVRELRRDLARVKTVLREFELEQAKG
jgi:large subunit ribosomal protein L29